jgi:signal recognition particle receptor subunit beta
MKDAFMRNVVSWRELEYYLSKVFLFIPKVIVFNKQDLSPKMEKDSFLAAIKASKYYNLEITESVAIEGEGVVPSFRTMLKLILENNTLLNPPILEQETKNIAI